MGTGPFRLTDISSQRAVLDANTAYYAGEPNIRRFELRFYPDEPSLLTALKAGEVDNALFRSPLDASDLQDLESNPDWQVLHLPSTTSTVLYFNNAVALLQDKKVRQALAYATDRGQIIADDSEWSGGAGRQPHPRRHVGLLRRPRPLHLRPDSGGEAPRRGGLDASGNWRAGEGRPGDAPEHRHERRRAATGRRAGDRGVVVGGGRADRRLDARADDPPARHPDAAARSRSRCTASTAARTPDPYPAYHTSQAGPGGDNLSGFSNPDADILLQTARQTSDVAVRLALYRQFQEVFASEVPSLPLFQRTLTYVIEQGTCRAWDSSVLFNSSSRFAKSGTGARMADTPGRLHHHAHDRLRPLRALRRRDEGRHPQRQPAGDHRRHHARGAAAASRRGKLSAGAAPGRTSRRAACTSRSSIRASAANGGRWSLATPAGFFVGPDNGVLSAALPDSADRAASAASPSRCDSPRGTSRWPSANPAYMRHPVSSTFHGRDVFAPVAAHLTLGVDIDSFGERVDFDSRAAALEGCEEGRWESGGSRHPRRPLWQPGHQHSRRRPRWRRRDGRDRGRSGARSRQHLRRRRRPGRANRQQRLPGGGDAAGRRGASCWKRDLDTPVSVKPVVVRLKRPQ